MRRSPDSAYRNSGYYFRMIREIYHSLHFFFFSRVMEKTAITILLHIGKILIYAVVVSKMII